MPRKGFIMKTTTPHNVSAGQVCDFNFNDDVVVGLFRSHKYTGPVDQGFRPFEVKKNGMVVWSYKTAAGPGQIADIVKYGVDDYVIYTADRNAVYSTLRLGSLAHATSAKLGDGILLIGGDTPEQVLDAKMAVATELGLDFWFSDEERVIVEKRRQAVSAERQAETTAKNAAKEEARRKREEFRQEVLARKNVEAWGADGKHFFGTPVSNDDEWKCLPDGRYCILLKDGQPSEAFIVSKANSAVKKVRPTEVSGDKPKTTKNEPVAALFVQTVMLKEQSRSVPFFSSLEDVKRLQAAGLNGGTWVGVASGDGSELTVYTVKAKDIETVGILKKRQQPVA